MTLDIRPAVDLARATYSWSLPYGFVAHFGGPAFDLEDPGTRKAWLQSLSGSDEWVMPKQQHGGTVLSDFVRSSNLDNLCDGLVTTDATLGLGVFGSDCPSLILLSPTAHAIAHCGWRGIAAGIVENAVDALRHAGDGPRHEIEAFIGPGICGSCYDVDRPVLEAYDWPNGAISERAGDKARLDLSIAIAVLLKRAGIHAITHAGMCTACEPHLHSSRVNGPGVVQVMALHSSARPNR